MNERLRRNAVVKLLGTPDRTEGSLNDPRTHEENGIRFNEKWIYEHLHCDPAGVPMRVVYWHRYDFMGTVVRADGSEEWRSDGRLAEVLANADDRLAPHDNNRNSPVTPSNQYRPASHNKNVADLGGHFEGSSRLF